MSAPDARGVPERLRPLPPHPDIQFERKRAKRLLRAARAGAADAVQAMRRVAGHVPRADWKLALAQLAVAREYGFSSWTRLKQYYEMWDRHRQTDHGFGPRSLETCEHRVKRILSWHERKIPLGAQMIATFLPRLYGRTVEEVLASPITEDEARFVAAREERYADWAELLRHASPARYEGLTREERRAKSEREQAERAKTPEGRAYAAIRESNLDALAAIAAEHPRLIGRFESVYRGRKTLVGAALHAEHDRRSPEARAVVDWLAARVADAQTVLDGFLAFGPTVRSADDVNYWVARGANPDRIWPNGATTLERALVMYNVGESNPAAIDALFRHVRHMPRAFWVAAGIGDVRATLGYLDKAGRPTAAARKRRPDFTALCASALPLVPDAPDEVVIFEAFWVAVLNGRADALRAIVGRGFPVDAAPWHSTALHMAVGCGSYESVECLLGLGADPDAPQFQNTSPRWLATEAAKGAALESPRIRVAALLAAAPARRRAPGP